VRGLKVRLVLACSCASLSLSLWVLLLGAREAGNYRIHRCEPALRVGGKEQCPQIVVWQLWCVVEPAKDLVGPVGVHVVVTVSLNTEKKGRGGRIPGVTLRDWLVEATGILTTPQTVVLYIVDQLDEVHSDEAISKLKEGGLGAEDSEDTCKDGDMPEREPGHTVLNYMGGQWGAGLTLSL